jgi:glycosyltransferase involved in cell wall biosynthesis
VRGFELVVADDGSGPDTRAIVERFGAAHVRQENTGFRKARIVNEAVRRSRGRTLIFSDGDCVPPAEFVEAHLAAAGPRDCAGGSDRGPLERIGMAGLRFDAITMSDSS